MEKNYDEIVIGNIERRIKKSGLMKRVVAERAGMSKADLSNVLHGRRILRIDTLFRISEALGVSPEELLKQ